MRLGRAYSELDSLAEDAWEWLKERADLPPNDWKVETLARRDDPLRSHKSQLVTHKTAGRFTYKFQLRPHSPDGFGKHFRMQQTAFDAFPHSDAFTLPKPVFVDEKRQVSLLTFIEGEPVSDAMKHCRSLDEKFDLLTRCGAWLDLFHRSQEHDVRKFQPKYTLNYYLTLRNEIKSGEREVAAKSLFLRGIEKLIEIAPMFERRQTVGAIQHGDFHLRNLILSGGQIAGIDVSKAHVAPVGYDIAKILLDFTTVVRAGDIPPDGQIVHRDTIEAFFRGYKLVSTDDPSVAFLLFARVLATLNTVQANMIERTNAKQRTLKRLKPIARGAFQLTSSKSSPRSKKAVRFLLTKRSLDAARGGDHEFVNAVKAALTPLGFKVLCSRNSPHNRAQLEPDDLTLVHMSEPVGRNGLVFCRAYAGPFWHLETRAARWRWRIAEATFDPDRIDQDAANAFFESWRDRLILPDDKVIRSGDFIYMPLQGKLLHRRSFQAVSPIEMIKVTLQHTGLPIRATLHPSEDYSDEEMLALEDIRAVSDRFELTQMPMHDALSDCKFVVTENSSAAFHAVLYEKPSILFAEIDFQHICEPFDPSYPEAAFDAIGAANREYQKYLYWYWGENCINLEKENADAALVDRMKHLGWSFT